MICWKQLREHFPNNWSWKERKEIYFVLLKVASSTTTIFCFYYFLWDGAAAKNAAALDNYELLYFCWITVRIKTSFMGSAGGKWAKHSDNQQLQFSKYGFSTKLIDKIKTPPKETVWWAAPCYQTKQPAVKVLFTLSPFLLVVAEFLDLAVWRVEKLGVVSSTC